MDDKLLRDMKKRIPTVTPIPQNRLAERLEDELDFDYNVDIERIDTIYDFQEKLLDPFKDGKHRFYRGERCDSITRPLIPTIFRNKDSFFDNGKSVILVDAPCLYDFYKTKSGFFDFYENVIAPVNPDKMYDFLSMAQHYFGISPLIDFTKSLEVALSFAIKGRKKVEEDILVYELELKSTDDYTTSIDVANNWLSDYSVMVFRNVTRRDFENPFEMISNYKLIYEKFKGSSFLEMNSPSAKLIDVPTNDLIKFQQGVFLLLDDFSLIGKSYLTKKVRNDFNLKKWIINKDICHGILEWQQRECPYYSYENITDLANVAAKIKRENKLYQV